MNTDRLEEFVMLAKELNFSQAAQKLFISQPILSRHISELEKSFGHKLFERDTHGVRLTDEGRYLLKWVDPFLMKEQQVLSSMAEEPFTESATIRIICSEQVITTPILTFVHAFTESYPDIHLDMIPVIMEDRREHLFSCDVILTSAAFINLSASDVSVTHLMDQISLLAIPPQHHLGDYQEISLGDLSGQTIIVPFAGNMYGPYARNAITANRKCHGTVKRISAESAQAGLLKVEMGAGVMLMPHHLEHRVYPHTRTVRVTDPDCVFPIYAYRNKSNENRAADLFYEKICDRFAGNNK